MTKGKGIKRKGNNKQSLNQQTPVTVDANKSDEVTNLRSLNEHNKERKEIDELKNKVREYNDETEELKAKLSEGGRLLDSSKTELEVTVAGLQNELNETRVLSLKHEEACIQLRHEKMELEDQLKELNKRNEELHAKMTENGCSWDACKASLEGTIIKQQKKLNETKILAHNNQVLCNELSREKTELENNLNHSINETKQLKEKMDEDSHLWDTCKGEFEVTVANLQNELNEVRMLSQKHQDSWSQSGQEKNELESNLNDSINKTKQLKEKMAEDAHLWDTCKGESEVTVAKLQNELNEVRMLSQKHQDLWSQSGQEKNELEKSLIGLQKELDETKILAHNNQVLCNELIREKTELESNLNDSINETKQLKEKMAEDAHLWDTCKGEFEVTVAKLQSELNEVRMLSQKHEDSWSQSGEEKNKLEKTLIGLQIELDRTKILSEKHQELCNVLREENKKLGNKFNQCNNRIGELNTKIEQDGRLWVTDKADLESKVAGLEHEKRTVTQQYKLLCTHLTDENDKLEQKLRECNDMNKKLHEQIREDCSLWEACKAKFEDSVAALENKLDLMTNEGRILSQKYVELCSECEFLKAQLGDYNDTLSSVEDEKLSLMDLSESNAKRVEALQTQVQLITDERTHLSKKYEELSTENEALKLKLENYKHRLDSVEKESAGLEEANVSLKQEVQELQNKLGMRANDYKQVSNDVMLDSATVEGQLLKSLSETSDKLMEDMVIENTTVKQEVLRLNQQNQLSQKDRLNKKPILNKKPLLPTKDGKITELNATIIKLKNGLEKLEKIGRKNTKILKEYGGLREEQVKRKESEEKRKEGSGRVSHGNQTAFIGNLMSCILLDDKSTASRCLSTGTKRIILPSYALFCGYPYGWFGGIV